MKFQWLLTVCAFGLAMTTAVASAEEIAVVMSRSLVPYKKTFHGLRRAWEGTIITSQNTLTRYDLEGNTAQARIMLDQIARSEAAAVVTIGTEATLAVRERLRDLPVVYSLVLEPQTFAHQPSAGVLLAVPLETKLALLKTLLPRAKTVGVLYNPGYNAQAVNRLHDATAANNLRLLSAAVMSAADISGVLEKFTGDQVDVLLALTDPTTGRPEAVQLQSQHCQKHKLAYWAESEQAVREGALLALIPDFEAAGAQTADLTRRVLETGDTYPAQPPGKMLLLINDAAWKNLGLAEVPALPDTTVVRF